MNRHLRSRRRYPIMIPLLRWRSLVLVPVTAVFDLLYDHPANEHQIANAH